MVIEGPVVAVFVALCFRRQVLVHDGLAKRSTCSSALKVNKTSQRTKSEVTYVVRQGLSMTCLLSGTPNKQNDTPYRRLSCTAIHVSNWLRYRSKDGRKHTKHPFHVSLIVTSLIIAAQLASNALLVDNSRTTRVLVFLADNVGRRCRIQDVTTQSAAG